MIEVADMVLRMLRIALPTPAGGDPGAPPPTGTR